MNKNKYRVIWKPRFLEGRKVEYASEKLTGIDEKEFLRDCIKVEQNLILEKMDGVCKKGNSIMQLIKLRERYKKLEKLSKELRNI